MKKALRIATLISLALLTCSNPVWAAAESAIASGPGLEPMILFGAVIFGMISVNKIKHKN